MKNVVKKNVLAKMGIFTIVMSASAISIAQTSVNAIEVAEASVANSELTVKFSDVQEVPNQCDYALTRMELIEAIDTLVIQLKAPEPCFLDRYGKRTGSMKWELPAKYRRESRLNLLINGKKAGALKFSNGAVSVQKNQE